MVLDNQFLLKLGSIINFIAIKLFFGCKIITCSSAANSAHPNSHERLKTLKEKSSVFCFYKLSVESNNDDRFILQPR